MGGFQDYANSILRNNKRMRGPGSKMSDAHLNIAKSKWRKKYSDKKMSSEDFEIFKLKLISERKAETVQTLVIVIILLIIFAVLGIAIL